MGWLGIVDHLLGFDGCKRQLIGTHSNNRACIPLARQQGHRSPREGRVSDHIFYVVLPDRGSTSGGTSCSSSRTMRTERVNILRPRRAGSFEVGRTGKIAPVQGPGTRARG